MAISSIGSGAGGIAPIQFPKLDQVKDAGEGTPSTGFASKLADSIGNLQEVQSKSDNLAVQAATGQLKDVHDYMIAANKAEIATQLTVAVRNKAVESFNQIMNMQV